VLSKLLIHYISVQEIVSLFLAKNKNASDKIYTIPKEFLFPTENVFYGFDCYIASSTSIFSGIPIEYARLLVTFLQCVFIFLVIMAMYGILVFSLHKFMKLKMKIIKSNYLEFSAMVNSLLFFLYYIQ